MKAGDFLSGRYQIEEELGRGARGIVYRARDTESDSTVAIKVYLDSFRDRRVVDELRREFEMLSGLSHPGLVKVHSHATYYYTMEFVRGRTFFEGLGELADRTVGTGRRLEVILDLAVQLAETLAYLHEQGVVHRDLKPENVLVDENGGVKLTDFGLAERKEILEVLPPRRLRAGSILYGAPEQIRGEEADERSDLYSLGVLLYEACAGSHPFRAPDPGQTLLNHLTQRHVPLGAHRPDTPWDLEVIVDQLLEKEPEDRFQEAAEVGARLRRLREELAHGVPSPPFVGRREVLGALTHALAQSQKGHGAVVVLEGELGQGKTRALAELARVAGVRGAWVLRGESRAGDSSALAPWCRVMAQGLALLHRVSPAVSARAAEAWTTAFGQLACYPWNGLGTLTAPEAAPVDALAGLLGRLCQHSAAVVVLDDFHVASPRSWRILPSLARRVVGLRVLFCVGVPAGSEVSRELHAWDSCQRVTLPPFSPREARAVAAVLASEGRLGADVVEKLWTQTGGNAGAFTSEIVSRLRGREVLAPQGLPIPEALREVGERSGCDELERAGTLLALGRPHDALPVLRQLVQQRGLGPALRAKAQVVAGGCLSHLGRLVEAAGWYEQGLKFLDDEAAAAETLPAFEELADVYEALGRASEAHRCLRRAASFLRDEDSVLKVRIDLRSALLELRATGGTTSADRLFQMTGTLEGVPPALVARLALAEAEWGRWDSARSHGKQAEVGARASDDSGVVAECLLLAAKRQLLEGRLLGALKQARAALRCSRKASHRLLLGECYALLGTLYGAIGSYGRAAAALTRCLGVAHDIPHPRLLSHAQRELALVLLRLDAVDVDGARELLARAREAAARSGVLSEQVECDGALAELVLGAGHRKGAAAAARRALRAAQQVQTPIVLGCALVWAARAKAGAAAGRNVKDLFRRGRKILARGGFAYYEARARVAYGGWLVSRGKRQGARVLQRAREDLGAMGASLDLQVAGPGVRSDRGPEAQATALDHLARALSGVANPGDVAAACVKMVVHVIGSERGFLLLRGPGGEMKLAAGADMNGDSVHGDAATLSQGILQRVVRTRKGIFSLDARTDPRFSDRWSVQEYDIRSVLCSPLMAGGEVAGILYLDNRFVAESFGPADLRILDALARQSSPAVLLASRAASLEEKFTGTVRALAASVDAKDPYTRGHSRRVSRISVAIAEEMGLDSKSVRVVELGALLHDVGKIGTPEHLLASGAPLPDYDAQAVRQHPLLGAQILSPIPEFQEVVTVVLQHHEHLDGSGYPLGLRGDQIGDTARIVAVADAIDELTTDHPDRPRMSMEEACREVGRSAGARFDPRVVAAFLRAVERGRIGPS